MAELQYPSNFSSSASSLLLLDAAARDDDDQYEEEKSPSHSMCSRCKLERHRRCPRSLVWIVYVALTVFSMVNIYLANGKYKESLRSCAEHTSLYSPFLDFVEYETVRFAGSLAPESVWTGKPRPELDAAWDAVADGHPAMSITEEQARKAGVYFDLRSLSRYPPERGGGIHVQLEWAHQLHCVNLLRKAIHRDYYQDIEMAFGNHTEADILTHLDHCVNILRQNIMCNADMGPVFFYWIEGRDHFHIDFSNEHVCRNFGTVLQKSSELEVRIGSLEEFARFQRTVPEGVVPLQDFPEHMYQSVEKDRLGHPYYL